MLTNSQNTVVSSWTEHIIAILFNNRFYDGSVEGGLFLFGLCAESLHSRQGNLQDDKLQRVV